MCDTAVLVEPGRVWFLKNSDREPNEAQVISHVPRAEHDEGARLRCTWTTIRQARQTHATWLSRPYWMWGAEMGANEHGVAIGNQAVFARGVLEAEGGLLGMDLVRLALERAVSAGEAVEVIRALITAHGQGGRAGVWDAGFRYHNSFLVADASGAFVVEAVGRDVHAERLPVGAYAISNALRTDTMRGRAKRIHGAVARARRRSACVEAALGRVRSVRDVAAALRSHGPSAGEDDGPVYSPASGALGAPCVHAGGALVSTQTTASWISELTPGGARHWATGTSTPCLALFLPLPGAGEPSAGSAWPSTTGRPGGVRDGGSWFWQFEDKRRALEAGRIPKEAWRAERDALEELLWRGELDAAEGLRRWRRTLHELSPDARGRDPRPLWLRAVWTRERRRAAATRAPLPWRDPT